MGTVLEKANEIKKTKNKLKEAINNGGGQITDDTIFNNYANEIKDIYIDAISNGVDNIYNNFPKITGEGSEITLDTEEAPVKMILEGNTSQKTSILPDGYTQVDYIEGTGTQYLDTGLILTQDNSVELSLMFNVTNKLQGIFGSRSGASDNNISINTGADTTLALDFNNSTYSTYRAGIKVSANTKYILYNSKEKRVMYDNNKNILAENNTLCEDIITTPNTATLFYINPKPSNTWYNASAKIYYCKIWDNNILVRDIIPCYRNSDNVVGMYDLITDTFYTNQGTDVFTYGNVVQIPNPDYPQDIKVVTGEQNVKIMNRNLFNPDLIKTSSGTITVGEDGSIIMTNATSSSNGFYEINKNFGVLCPDLKVGDEVYLYLESDWTSGRRYLWNSDLGQWKNGQKKVLTAGMLNKHLVIYGGYRTTSTLKIMITKNKYYSEFLKYQPKQIYPLSLGNIELVKIGNYKDYIFKNEVNNSYYNTDLDLNEWYYSNLFTKINNYNEETIITPYISTTGGLDIGAIIYYYNNSNTPIKITDEILISQLENINNNAKSYSGTTIIECSSVNDNNEVIKTSITALKNIDLIESEWEE